MRANVVQFVMQIVMQFGVTISYNGRVLRGRFYGEVSDGLSVVGTGVNRLRGLNFGRLIPA